MALGATLRRRRKQRSNVLEIETRRPASLAHMREWLTDDEGVLDDLSAPVGPDNRRPIDTDHTETALHRSVIIIVHWTHLSLINKSP